MRNDQENKRSHKSNVEPAVPVGGLSQSVRSTEHCRKVVRGRGDGKWDGHGLSDRPGCRFSSDGFLNHDRVSGIFGIAT